MLPPWASSRIQRLEDARVECFIGDQRIGHFAAA
jgi:hypothetical protein